ncbi:putative dehydrogenase [Micromonospora pisi]|uniref:Putative dehydrogenase n=1 Tax=Micromonospora pisi TaxID=589240 RepID=A0A495JJ00_9ACTN|nr:Gfo/Idh/MocA family oxidoreductase [Micromonospora pisi]RKR88913.1 putative dehydrogenase [Micromonospora pisi]
MTGRSDPPRVALIGASGHGRWHRQVIAQLRTAGRLELVALVDVRPVEPLPDADGESSTRVFTDHQEMLRSVRPEVVVVCTPPHTHLPIALDVLASGADLLLEKPPVLSLAEHRRLAEARVASGRAVQVGFQALGSTALTTLLDAIAQGRLGTVTGIATVASWQRTDAYYARSPWAGRRFLDGRPVLDGALVNPLAHALMQCLAVASAVPSARNVGAAEPVAIELERYRTRPIEVDDTASLRVSLGSGLPVVAAVTLAGEEFIPGEVIVRGTAGRAVLEYPTDRLLLPGDPEPREISGRVGLLENLLDHRVDPDRVPLLVPLARTTGFTALVEAIHAAPEPTLLGGATVVGSGEPPERVWSIRGVNRVLLRAAEEGALLHELGVPWAVKPYRVALGEETGNG